jgi:hypothetical protein
MPAQSNHLEGFPGIWGQNRPIRSKKTHRIAQDATFCPQTTLTTLKTAGSVPLPVLRVVDLAATSELVQLSVWPV